MGGLIDAAKRKIWFIAKEVQRAQPRELKIGLVAYRDRGDAYLTQVTPLSADLDAVYQKLSALEANGGGDGPEDVNAALHDAVTKMAWSADKDTLRMIFVVGDAPPHMDYDAPKWASSAAQAVKKSIYVNTIQCGNDTTTTAVWKDIAHASEGRFARIAADGGPVVAIATPYDADLARLGGELDKTYLDYGRADARKAKESSRAGAGMLAASAPAVAADRAAFKASAAISARDDIVSLASEKGDAGRALASVKEEALPEVLQGKSKAEQKVIVEQKAAQRATVQRQIAELAQKRDAHIAQAQAEAARAASAAGGRGDAFDSEVVDTIFGQGAGVGLKR
jgi:hypothetical protein